MSQMTRRALLVGIDEYPDATLSCCANDARGLADALESTEYGFATSLLTDKEATRRQIMRQLANVEDSPPRLFVLYFAGHGCVTSLGTYLVTIDGEPYNEGLGLDILARILENLAAKDVTTIVILDCCHSGAASPWSGARALHVQEVERSIPSLGKSRVVMAACRPDQLAFEDPASGHGLFTHYLIRGLLGNAADHDGCITAYGLYDYAARPFEQATKQTPIFRADIEGRVVLGSGFTAQNTPPLAIDQESRIIAEATQFLDSYIRCTNVSLEEWKNSGFQTACKTLEPVLRWFRRQLADHPGLATIKAFAELWASAQMRVAHLGNIDAGTRFMGGQLTQRLGDGSFGNVWKIVRENDPRLSCAYKVYHPHELRVAEKLARFERGHRAMKKLDHPNIVHVGEYTHCPVGFMMDYIDGPNLRQLGQGLEEPSAKVRLLITVADTLRHAHGRDVIHRDIKPENIITEYDIDRGVWRPHLTDFDLAWFSTATQFTKEAFGTTFYAAPEQLAHPSSQLAHNFTVDIYSFGQLAYFVATGADPVPLGLADNARALKNRLSDWSSERAAREFYELYRDCSALKPKDRLADFTVVLERLGDVRHALREVDETHGLDRKRFLEEIAYSLVGLAAENETGGFMSVSGQTVISLHVTDENADRCKVVACLSPSRALALEGVTNDRARLILNTRVDEALKGLERVRRRSGQRGSYEVFLDFESVRKDGKGIQVCRTALLRTIGALERQ